MNSLPPRDPKPSGAPRPHGFTLIELLTVIAIIGILAAILIPVVGKARESAHAAQCLSNIRQISLAMLMFADGNNGQLPTSGDTDQGAAQLTDWILWRGATGAFGIENSAIVPYLGGTFSPEIYRCPSDERIADPDAVYSYSYTLNRELGEGRTLNGRVHSVEDPTLIILMVEEGNPNDSSAWLIDSSLDFLTKRHGGRGHVSFVDAHVEPVYPEYVNYEGHWNPFPPNLRPYTGRR